MTKRTVILAVILLKTMCHCQRNNVCKTYNDYRTIDFNTNCWYDADVDSDPEQIAKRYNFPFESHQVTSPDGYILTLFRVPHDGIDTVRKRQPVLLQHGIAVDSKSWMFLGAESLPFHLARNGYDVWLANVRGTKFSSQHTNFSIHSREYWNFSFHEMAIYDIPVILRYIAHKTGQKGQISYIGHSMGCTIALVYTSIKPRHAAKYLKNAIFLAPVAYMDHVEGLFKALAPLAHKIWDIANSAGFYGIGPNLQYKVDFIHQACSSYPTAIFCLLNLASVAGENQNETLYERFPIGFSNWPSGLSLKTIYHYAQILTASHSFQLFDYGPGRNLELYNATTPPEYPLGRIDVPIRILYGNQDVLAVGQDIEYLYGKLKTKRSIMEVFNLSHNDFLIGRRGPDLYRLLLEYLRKD